MALLRLYTFADHGYRNISMRHWNETQPGGQGLLNDFENYFKALSDTDKEVLKVAQTAARKLKTAAKKATEATNNA